MPTLLRRSLADAVAAATHAEHVTITATDQHVTIVGADMWLTTVTQLGWNPPNTPDPSNTAKLPRRGSRDPTMPAILIPPPTVRSQPSPTGVL